MFVYVEKMNQNGGSDGRWHIRSTFLGLGLLLGLSEELWNNNPSFARSEEDPGRLLFRRSLVVHVYVESLKYTKARILHVPWSFFWVRYHRYVGRYHTVGSYAKYVGR